MALAVSLNGDLVPIPQSGGSSSAQLPVWAFQASDNSDPTAGKFTTDGDKPSLTNTIKVSDTQKGGGAGSWSGTLTALPPDHSVVVLVGANGVAQTFTVTSASFSGGYTSIGVTGLAVDAVNWSGDYALSFMPHDSVPVPSLSQVLSASSISPVPDGTYTVGIGGSQNGTITTVNGVITAIQQAS